MGRTFFIIFNGPKKLVLKLFSISISGISSNGPVMPTPALLIKTSILPSILIISSMHLSILTELITFKLNN